jgi:hypothetical protein
MKTITKILFIAIALVALNVSQSIAQLKPGSGLLSTTGAYTIFSIKDSGETIDGGGFQVGYESVNLDGNFALGGALGYLVGIEEESDSQVRYSTLPLWLTGKYLFGPEKAKFFLSGGLGFQISQRTYSGSVAVPLSTIGGWDAGVSFGLGTGINYYFTEKVCGIVSYNAQFYSNAWYKSGMAHVFNFGIGFQLN